MALQSQLLAKLLGEDGGTVVFLASNFRLPAGLCWAERVPGLRTIFRFFLVWFKLWAMVRQVDIVHVFAASWLYFFLVVAPAVIVARTLGKRIVLNYRGGGAERFFDFYSWVVAPIFKLAHAVTAPSEFLAKPIRARFSVPVSIVPNILDSHAFPFRERVAVRPRMLVARHLEEIYDVESVLKAFRLIQEHYPEASLVIAGTGSREEHLRSLVVRWDLKNVRFLGHVARPDLGAVYDECDILLNASRIDNFPGTLIEASGAGLVVISTRAGGIPWIYEDRKSALLVDVGDASELARAACAVLANASLGKKLTTAALEVARGCHWSEVRKRLYYVYGFKSELGEFETAPLRPSDSPLITAEGK